MLMKRGHELILQIFLLSTFSLIVRTVHSNTQGVKPSQGYKQTPGIPVNASSIKAQTIKLNTATINATMTMIPILSRTTNATTSIHASKTSLTASYVSTSVHVTTPRPSTPKPDKGGTGRKFDGLSFFGGVILGATICVVLFFSVKYYQAKKRSYHSL